MRTETSGATKRGWAGWWRACAIFSLAWAVEGCSSSTSQPAADAAPRTDLGQVEEPDGSADTGPTEVRDTGSMEVHDTGSVGPADTGGQCPEPLGSLGCPATYPTEPVAPFCGGGSGSGRLESGMCAGNRALFLSNVTSCCYDSQDVLIGERLWADRPGFCVYTNERRTGQGCCISPSPMNECTDAGSPVPDAGAAD